MSHSETNIDLQESLISDTRAKLKTLRSTIEKTNEDPSKLTSIDQTKAKQLVQIYKNQELDLSGLTQLTPDVALQLRNHIGKLRLDGLANIDESIAMILSSHLGGLDLSGLTSISESIADILANTVGNVRLYGLKDLNEGVAAALSKHNGDLYFRDIQAISEQVATILVKHNGDLHFENTPKPSHISTSFAGFKKKIHFMDGSYPD